MERYSLAVALFDFVPVAVNALGVSLLARGIAARHAALAPLAWTAAALIPLGGLCKASWKLGVALQGSAPDWLQNLLFIALAPGFIALAFCFHHAQRAWRLAQPPAQATYPRGRLLLWLALPLSAAGLFAWTAPDTRLWFFSLLALTTLANAVLIVESIRAVLWSGAGRAAAAALAWNFAATLALAGLARLPQSEATAWLQQSVNLSAQAALAYGFWRLSLRMRLAGPLEKP